MEGSAVLNAQPTPASTDPNAPARVSLGQHLLYLAILIVLAGAVRFWLIGHTEVAARDSIGYIRYALGFERPFFNRTKLFIGGEIRDLTASDDQWQVTSTEASLAAIGPRLSFRDYSTRSPLKTLLLAGLKTGWLRTSARLPMGTLPTTLVTAWAANTRPTRPAS